MLQGFYTAASGMLMQQRALNVISHNLANVNTPGYKTSRLMSETFQQELLTRLQNGRNTNIGTGEPARIVREAANVFDPSGLQETGNPFDVGLTGAGFFNIQGEDGQVYLTRNGQFALDEDHYLVLRGKGRVMGVGGPIQLNTSDILINDRGQITNAVSGAALGQLNITIPAENADIEVARNGMYIAAGGPGAQAPDPGVVQQWVETSNVNMTDEMTAMMAAQRNFAAASQALQWIDASYAKAVNIASL